MKTFNLNILQTSDVHGYIYPYSYADSKNANHGFAKLHTLIKSLRTENTILIDTGDTIQGSPFTYFHAKYFKNQKNPITKIMNIMKYDYVTIGNHEFNYGREYMNHYYNGLKAKILNANILKKDTKEPLFGLRYDIRDYQNGPKIATVGVTTHYIPNWEQPEHIADLHIKDAFLTVQKLIKEIKETEQPDFIIVNYHGGFERDPETGEITEIFTGENQGYMMMEEIPSINLLLTGHQHMLTSGKHKNTTYIQPSFNGQMLGQAKVKFELIDKEWQIVDTSVMLHSVEKIVPSKEVLEVVEVEEEKTQKWLDKPIGHLSNGDLLITDPLKDRIKKHPLVTLINQIQLDYTDAEISVTSLGNFVSGFKQDITMRHLVSTYVYPNTLVVKALDKESLLKSLEKTASFFEVANGKIVFSTKYTYPKLKLYDYDMFDGISYTINLSKPVGKRIEDVMFKGEPLHFNKLYKVVMNNYRASGGGEYFWLKDMKTIGESQTDFVEIMTDYIMKHKILTINHEDNIKIKMHS